MNRGVSHNELISQLHGEDREKGADVGRGGGGRKEGVRERMNRETGSCSLIHRITMMRRTRVRGANAARRDGKGWGGE